MPSAYLSGRFVVYLAERATLTEWKHSARCTVISYRKQIGGMGSATVRLEQSPPDATPQLDRNPFPNDWAVIIDSTKMEWPVAPPDTLDVREVQGTNPTAICWFGRVSSVPEEMHQGDVNRHGIVEMNEPGFFLQGQAIRRSYSHPGYNPTIDGVQRGNYVDILYPRGRLARFEDEMGDPTDTGYAWTPRSVLYDLCENTLSFIIRPVFDISAELQFMDEPSAFPSYEGTSIIDALQEILNPLMVHFEVGLPTDPDVAIRMIVTSPIRATPPNDWDDFPVNPPPPPPYDPVEIDLTDTPCRRVMIMETEERYSRIRLRGPRIRIAATLTTFGPRRLDSENPNVTPVLVPDFSHVDLEDYAEAEDWTPSSWDIYDYLEGEGIDPDSDEARDEVDAIEGANRAYRDGKPKVYQRFVLRYDPGAITDISPTAAVYASENPGIIGVGIPLPDTPYDHSQTYPTFPHQFLFPRFDFQNLDNYRLLRDPVILEGEHATPNPAAFEVMDFVPHKVNDEYIEPFILVRGIATIDDDASVEDYRIPLWFDISEPGPNKQTIGWQLNGFRLLLDAPFPELLGCSDESIWRDRLGASGETISAESAWVTDNERGEWSQENEDQGYSDRNPDFPRFGSASFWPDRAHWSRMVCTVGLLSDQRYEVIYEDPGIHDIVEKEKVIEDPDLIMEVRLRGLVTGRQVGFLDGRRSIAELDYEDSPTVITRKPVEEANATLWALWEWYSKVKRSVTIEWNLFQEPGEDPDTAYDPGFEVGDIIDKIVDPKPIHAPGADREIFINTHVSTIEVFVEDEEPRTVLTTDIPVAPPLSRFRRMQLA